METGYPYPDALPWILDDSLDSMWMNHSLKELPAPREEEEEEEPLEELFVAETYADYMPSKLKFGRPHPDPVVETASLSSVTPVDVWYKLSIPNRPIEKGHLSALQLESITYAAQQHEHILPNGSRAGFLIGDGAGVGKGRTIAGILLDNYLKQRKRAIWVSISNDLKYDAERDLSDIGAEEIEVHSLNKFKYTDISSNINGHVTEGVIFSTYSALIGQSSKARGKYKSRFEQLLQWCGEDFDGLIIFDECHKAKNLCPVGSTKPSKTGLTVLRLQNELPKARVVYASATGASEPRNMAYMVRLGMWGDGTYFKDFTNFINVLSRGGVGAMEIVAMDMKLRGTYIARQLSFKGVVFNIQEVPLTAEFIKAYDASVLLWVEALKVFQETEEMLDVNKPEDKRTKKIMWGQFWGSHQRFFKYFCIAAKVGHTVNIAKEAIQAGKCVVIGLQSTGEARTLEKLEQDDDELTDFISTAKGVFQNLVEKHLPCIEGKRIPGSSGRQLPSSSQSTTSLITGTKRKSKKQVPAKTVKKTKRFTLDTESSDSENQTSDVDSELDFTDSYFQPRFFTGGDEKKKYLLREIDKLGKQLPPNTLDQLIDKLGGPKKVAEMTGRKGRLVQTRGGFQYESRSKSEVSLEMINLMEKKHFMDGVKDIAIISEAASSGISLQSDRRVRNQRRRVHITLELPWSADRAIQQFGRTHRSNQVNAPEYIFLISNIAGERRFASVVAKRLESLGALTHGDRRATETRDLSQFNIDNKYGRMALQATMKAIKGVRAPMVQPPQDYHGDFFRDVIKALIGVGLLGENEIGELDKGYNDMTKFLNRILGIPVDLQNRLFQYFTDTLDAVITQAKRVGMFDLGILDLGAGGEDVNCVRRITFLRKHATGTAPTELHTIHVEKGMSWEEAENKWTELRGPNEGFYMSKQVRGNKRAVILAVEIDSRMDRSDENKSKQMYYVFKPNSGLQVREENLAELENKFIMAKSTIAEELWTQHYNASLSTCYHKYWLNYCRTVNIGYECDVGLRRRIYNVLSGSVLSVWSLIEDIFEDMYGPDNIKMQVVRLKTNDKLKVVGILIPETSVIALIEALSNDAENVRKESF